MTINRLRYTAINRRFFFKGISIFIALHGILLSSCSKSNIPPIKTVVIETPEIAVEKKLILPKPNESESSLTLSNFPNNTGPQSQWPLSLWIEELIRPRALILSGIEAKCHPKESNSILISLKNQKISCIELLSVNPEVKLGLECQEHQTLKAKTLSGPCVEQSSLSTLLKILRLPEGRGFYIKNTKTQRLEPNLELYPAFANSLHPIVLDDGESTRKYSYPNFKDWLLAQLDEGIIRLEFSIDSLNEKSIYKLSLLEELQKSIISFKNSQFFRPMLQIHSGNLLRSSAHASVTTKPNEKTPFFKISSSKNTLPLYKQTCDYVARWLHAHQILTTDPAKAKLVTLECHLEYGENFAQEPRLTLLRLPLPLQQIDSKIFPIKTYEESRSMTVLQGMMR